jgi:(2Fe-2S) ferredoxin
MMPRADYVATDNLRRSTARERYASNVYVVVCRGPNCRARGAMPLRHRLVKLLRHDPDVQLLGYSCFGQCDFGPNVAFYPPGEWYGALCRPEDAQRVVDHARGVKALDEAPLRLPAAEQAEHLRNIGELVRTVERDRGRRRRWWWPF